MPRFLNPSSVPAPAPRTSHGVFIGNTGKRLLISAQTGADRDGVLAQGIAAQVAQALDNLLAVIEAAQMQPADIVRLAAYATVADAEAVYQAAREARLGRHGPASLFLVVAGLGAPDCLFTIEGEALREA